MAHLFYQSGYRFAVAHCNFQLRGKESDLDEEFVAAATAKLHARFVSRRFETEKYATRNGISLQMAARELRYQWFEQLLADWDCQYLATAHHLNGRF